VKKENLGHLVVGKVTSGEGKKKPFHNAQKVANKTSSGKEEIALRVCQCCKNF